MADHLALASDKAFTKLLDQGGEFYVEAVRLSTKLVKFNRRNRAQERIFVLTSRAVYNLKNKSQTYTELQRKVELAKVVGLTKSASSDEMVMHVPSEYDYRYASPLKEVIAAELYRAHDLALAGAAHFLIWEVPEVSLVQYATTKSDHKKGVTRMPNPAKAINLEAPPEEAKNRGNRSRTIFAAPNANNSVTLEDFQILKVIGRGSFGKVMLVRKKNSEGLYAMKSLRKDALLEREQVEHTRTEKMILEHINHPFLNKLEYAFSTPEKIFFVMAFMKGGELFFHLKESRTFAEDRARFYAAQICLALGHLHEQNIVYRDLKPENILMDEEGNVCLTDFGMAKHLDEGAVAQSFCGTPEYLAPEIVAGRGHNKAADWWSYGVLLYEMLVGIPPFYNQNVQLMYELIQFGDLKFPQRRPLSPQAVDIVSRLLDRNPDRRLGARSVEDVKTHLFFEGVNWEDVFAKRVPPPFRPPLSEAASTENFESEFTEEDAVNSLVPEHKARFVEQHQEVFRDF